MILSRITLSPFGGLSDRSLALKPGLNIVLGPNEAGKSTYFNAVQRVLLTPVKLRKNSAEWQDMQRFLPIGGDTARVEVQFSCKGHTHMLVKTWGARQSCELRMPNGAVLADDATIALRLRDLLPASEATCRTVLMAYQGGLARTLGELKADGTALRSLGDILRSAVQETDGVSVDEVLRRLEEQHIAFFDRWDSSAEGPENNRGVGNPYVNRVGAILKAYYAKENLRVELERALAYEEQLDVLNIRINRLQLDIAASDTFLTNNRAAAESARERRVLQAQLSAVQGEMRVMRADNEEWPVVRANRARLAEAVPGLEKRLSELLGEEREARSAEAGKTFRDRLDRVTPETKKLGELESALKSIKPLAARDVDSLRTTQQRVTTAQAALAAGKLTIDFLARRAVTVAVTRDLDAAGEIAVGEGRTETFAAGARLRLEHADWSITVMSGDRDDVEATEKNLADTLSAFEKLLSVHGVTSVDEAVETSRRYVNAVGQVDTQRRTVEVLLDGLTYEDLVTKVAACGGSAVAKPLVDVVRDHEHMTSSLASTRNELAQFDKKIASLTATYGDPDALLLKVAEAAARQKRLTDSIASLAPLPAGIADADGFVAAFQRAEEQHQRLQREANTVLMDRARLEGSAPEQSSEEVHGLLDDAEEEFTRVRSQAGALSRVREVAVELAKSTDATTFAGLERELGRLTGIMTSGKHGMIDMKENMPAGFIRDDGRTVGYDLLSSGTKDVLALALRLSMAAYFLKDADGFVMMDDPLVDMDPERQARAAEVLREYSAKTQVVVFTCHPGHAELLGERTDCVRLDLTAR